MKRGQIMIRGVKEDGTEGPIDVMDLDEDSWRAFFAEQLCRVTRFGTRIPSEDLPGEEIRMRHKNAPRPQTVEVEGIDDRPVVESGETVSEQTA